MHLRFKSDQSHLIDAVDREVAEKLYAWIRPGKKTIPLARATEMLLEEQPLAVKAFKAAGCKVIIRTTVYPGINDDHVAKIARVVGECGADAIRLVPCSGVASREDQFLSPPDQATMRRLSKN
ncbi:MAG: hypothetical protein ABR605_10230, partial [Desulfurivibrionaceae bacterium]